LITYPLKMKNIKISTKLMILALILSGIIAFVGIMGILNLRIVNKGMQTLFKDRVLPLEELKNISDAYAISVVDIAHKARNGNITWNKALQELDVAQIKIDSNWVAYKKTKIEGKELELLKEAENLKFKAELVFIDLYGILKSS